MANSAEFKAQLAEFIPEHRFRYAPREIILNGTQELWFDADSTLSTIEGVDELARYKGVYEPVKAMTDIAMGKGGMHEIFPKRLEMIDPTLAETINMGQQYIDNLVEDALETVGILQALGLRIKIVSGGYDQSLRPLQKYLGLPDNALIANKLLFDEDGKYAGYDDTIPLWTDHGKPIVVLSQHARGDNAGTWGMVGDGKTDATAGKLANIFIGYGGVVHRLEVEAQADVYVTCRSLAPILVIAAGTKRWPYIMNTCYAPILIKGMEAICGGYVLLKGGFQEYQNEIERFIKEKPWEARIYNET